MIKSWCLILLKLLCELIGFNRGHSSVPLNEIVPVNVRLLIGAFNAKLLLTSVLV